VPWFFAWAAVGAGVALGISVIGVFAVPLALLLAVFLLVRHQADRSAFGILVGMGSVSLYVAHMQRKGPGTVSWHTATASGSSTYMDPRPWLVVDVLLVVIGVAAFLWHRPEVPAGEGSQE
jgi:hypothetical protein